ncbi:MAG: UDP-N-acetylmuramoyl-L-alanyl-D-glutamate--2,6-diaminopimelate ligase [Pseudomonadota bacterium]
MSLAALGLGGRLADDLSVSGLALDSRNVQVGEAFFALPGTQAHGAQFAEGAVARGAAVIVTDRDGAALLGQDPSAVVVEDPAAALAQAARAWFGAGPAVMAAVTGTNGKTSVASFTRQIWQALGLSAISLGTSGVEGAVTAPLAHTTPDAITLHRALAEAAAEGVSHGVMEASSHGIEQRRLDGVALTAAAFTNLSRDHLDYHPTVEAYAAAKLRLFDTLLPKDGVAVVHLDDPLGPRVRDAAQARGIRTIGVGGHVESALARTATTYSMAGQTLNFVWEGQVYLAHLDLLGHFQGDNALVAAGLAIACGAEAEAVFATLPGLEAVRGRMERVAARPNGAQIFVDYSHTPASLETALRALRPHVSGRLSVVFGAGGDRDPGKRPMMGEAAATYADCAIVTDDNPRSEDPAAIRRAVLAGCPEAEEIGDREEAIYAAIRDLAPGDALLIAGKGHESGQIVGSDVRPFDDAEVARAAVAAIDGAVSGP